MNRTEVFLRALLDNALYLVVIAASYILTSFIIRSKLIIESKILPVTLLFIFMMSIVILWDRGLKNSFINYGKGKT